MSSEEVNDATRRIYVANAEIMALWAARGAAIARKFKYGHLQGIDAIHRFLIEKYRWLPSEVRSLSLDEIELLLAGVDLPKAPKVEPRKGSRHPSQKSPSRGRLTLRR